MVVTFGIIFLDRCLPASFTWPFCAKLVNAHFCFICLRISESAVFIAPHFHCFSKVAQL